MKLLFGTRNAGKGRELQQMVGHQIEVVSLDAFPDVPEPVEDGSTFEANARKKALAYAAATGLWALADDSGLCVDALGGRPGVHSARYAPGDDAARIQKLLFELNQVPDERRGAQFQCALCLASPDGSTHVEVGECRGRIARQPSGTGGFGYDPVFVFPPLGKTLAELTRDEKSAISHRGQAFQKMKPRMLALLRA